MGHNSEGEAPEHNFVQAGEEMAGMILPVHSPKPMRGRPGAWQYP